MKSNTGNKWIVAVGLLVASFAFLSSLTIAGKGGSSNMKTQDNPTLEELRQQLTALQFHVTQENGAEPAFQNIYWKNKQPGIYVDVVSGEPLFSSVDKYDSGSGWPSFTEPLEESNIVFNKDISAFMTRIEVRSKHADSHLGHVFDDGPGPDGKRYCINSAAIRFVPVTQLKDEGYEAYLSAFSESETSSMQSEKPSEEVAILAAGCFWGFEDILKKVPGVLETDVGYIGGTIDNPTYADLTTGLSGHAEAVRVVFDPERISYEGILGYFFRLHNPTTLNRQGNDRGTQYRSAIFAQNDNQRAVAQRVKDDVSSSGKWDRRIVTVIEGAETFYPADDYHQDYLTKNPHGYTCHYLRP